MAILDEETREGVKEKLSSMENPVKIVFFKPENGCETCDIINELIDGLVSITPKLSKEVYILEKDTKKAQDLGIDKAPAIAMYGKEKRVIRFYGVPSGYEFSTFLSDIADLSRGAPEIQPEIADGVKRIDFPVHIQVFVTPTCPYCPAAVKVAHDFAMLNNKIKSDAIDVLEFRELGEKYVVMSVPKTVINEKIHLVGAYPPDILLKKILELKG
jgi:glutaredoxin-like protein